MRLTESGITYDVLTVSITYINNLVDDCVGKISRLVWTSAYSDISQRLFERHKCNKSERISTITLNYSAPMHFVSGTMAVLLTSEHISHGRLKDMARSGLFCQSIYVLSSN